MDFSFSVEGINTDQDAYLPLTPGVYECCAIECTVGPNKAGTGQLAKVKFQVLSSPGKGRMLTEWFNLEHPNIKAQEIGRKQFARFLKSIGKKAIASPNEVLNLPFRANIGVREDNYGGESRQVNFMKQFLEAGGSSSPTETPYRQKIVEATPSNPPPPSTPW